MAESPKNRIGTYRNRRSGVAAFHIETRPEDLRLDLTEELILSVDRATHAVGKLVGSAGLLPNPEQFVYMYLRLEAVLSSRIEGTQASLMDLLQFEQEWVDRERVDDITQVANHLKLLRTLERRGRRSPLTVEELEKAHQTLLSGTRGAPSLGKLRTVQNWIGAGGPIEEASFVPPPPEEVRPAMNDLVTFVNDDRRYPPIVRAGLAHAYFETIHPFVDGNGRIGRYLIHFILWKAGLMERPILYLSHYFRANQSEYYRRLQGTREAGGLEAFCLYLAKGTGEVASEAYERSQRVIKVRTDLERTIQTKLGRRTASGLVVLGAMYGHPIADVRRVCEWTGSSRAAANSLVQEMESAGVLVELTGQARNRRFALGKYLDLFTVMEE